MIKYAGDRVVHNETTSRWEDVGPTKITFSGKYDTRQRRQYPKRARWGNDVYDEAPASSPCAWEVDATLRYKAKMEGRGRRFNSLETDFPESDDPVRVFMTTYPLD
ncbi:MAG TPA: hypothetical protein VFJ58_23685 [Armatimonadota bacterium]|nr:hypothetical protein [Armatimonadota bacterium]